MQDYTAMDKQRECRIKLSLTSILYYDTWQDFELAV